MTGSPPSPISSEAAYENELPLEKASDELKDGLRQLLEAPDQMPADLHDDTADDAGGNLLNFPHKKPTINFPEDESLGSDKSFFGMAALHHSNQELKALLESLTSNSMETSIKDVESGEYATSAEEAKNIKHKAELVQPLRSKTYQKFSEQVVRYQSELERLHEEVETLSTEKIAAETENSILLREVGTLRRENRRLQKVASYIEEKFHALKARCAKIVYERSSQLRESEKQKNEIRELSAALEMRDNQLNQSEASFEDQRKIIEKLHVHIGKQQEHIAQLIRLQTKHKSEVEQYRELIKSTQDDLESTQQADRTKLDIRDREIERLKSVIDELQDHLEEFDYPQYRQVS